MVDACPFLVLADMITYSVLTAHLGRQVASKFTVIMLTWS